MSLPFKLIGMTTKDFHDEVERALDEVADMPSDGASEDSDNEDAELNEVTIAPHLCDIEVEEACEADDDFDPEDDIPLSRIVTEKKITWSKNNSAMPVQLPDFNSYAGLPDFIKHISDPTPCKLFKLFFTDDLVGNLVFQTNLYSLQKFSKHKCTDLEEMNLFIGLNLLMGIKQLPSHRDYWSSSPDLKDTYISELMPVKRFSWFLANLHANDNSVMPKRNEPTYDKLYKLRPYLTALSETFAMCMNPTREVAIDESMIKFKGRSYLKQYMPKKPIKRDYKVWILADKHGYCHKFDIYTGKSSSGIVEKNLGARVVLQLTNEIQNKGHLVYFDNYFSSVELMEELKSRKLYACGTVNYTRKNTPSNFFKTDKELCRGEYDWCCSNTGLSVLKWKDNRSVFLLSNYHNPTESTEVPRRDKKGNITNVACPVALTDYNKNINFVDKFDQNLSTYKIDRKSSKWYHRIFFYFLDASIINSYVIYKQLDLPPMTMKDFRRRVIDGLVSSRLVSNKRINNTDAPIALKRNKPFVPQEVRQNASMHQPQRSTRRRCALCSTKKKQILTDWICSTCNVPLCLGKNATCFQNYHAT